MDTHTQSRARREVPEATAFSESGRSPGAADRISVQFEADPSAAAWARSALTAVERRVEPDVMADVRLLVSELVTNSVRHSRMAPSGSVGLDVSAGSGMIRVEVCDSGAGFEPLPRDPGRTTAGGWGLFLVETIADRWGVGRNGLTRVWFEIDHGRSGARL